MSKKVLVLGSTGQIGHQVYNYLKANSDFQLYNIAYRKKLNDDTILRDVRNEEVFLKTISDLKPDVIINCIGILIEGALKDPENAIFINSYMPHRLKRLANELNSRLVHISTDCVFSGRKGQYVETDEKDGLDIYAKAKGLGEIIDDTHVTLRTSVIGPELKDDGEELFHWFMSQKKAVNGYTKAIWSGVSTIELAKAVKWVIDDNITGLYHVTNGESICKYDLLNLIKKYSGKDIQINKVDGKVTDKSFIDTRKERKYQIPSYEHMVKDLFDTINGNKSLYSFYTD